MMLPTTRTPWAAPESSMPSWPFSVTTFVRMRMLPPVEVISMPSAPLPKFGFVLKAARPQNVLYDVK